MQYELVFSDRFKSDCVYWERTQPKFRRKVSELLQSILADPRTGGIGKPERLKHYKPDEVWSRRISKEHRLLYKIEGNKVYLIYARHHYR